MWNYVNLYGAWNHSPFQAPGSWADAAHKNGTDMFSGIKFLILPVVVGRLLRNILI